MAYTYWMLSHVYDAPLALIAAKFARIAIHTLLSRFLRSLASLPAIQSPMLCATHTSAQPATSTSNPASPAPGTPRVHIDPPPLSHGLTVQRSLAAVKAAQDIRVFMPAMALTASVRRPACVGDYEVGRTLGVGATARVRLGRHRRTGALVALKIVPRDALLRGGDASRAVRREIAVLRLVAAGVVAVPGVLQLHDVIETDDSVVLALEYCPGGDLFDLLLESGCLPRPRVRSYFAQLAKALYICHLRGVCHRDLKLENVLIAEDGSLKIADFGMASLLKPSAFLGTSCGSPHYCAPELLCEQPYCGSKADVWSLGVMLYAMLCGGLPFDDDNLQRLKRKVCSGCLYIPPEIPADIAKLLRGMLTVDPDHRYSLQDVLQSEWLAFEELPTNLQKTESKDLPPVSNPDAEIISTLADLGLGNDFMLRRRLGGNRHCLERRLYYQIAATATDDQLEPIKPPNADRSPATIVPSNPFEEELQPKNTGLRRRLSAEGALVDIDDNYTTYI